MYVYQVPFGKEDQDTVREMQFWHGQLSQVEFDQDDLGTWTSG